MHLRLWQTLTVLFGLAPSHAIAGTYFCGPVPLPDPSDKNLTGDRYYVDPDRGRVIPPTFWIETDTGDYWELDGDSPASIKRRKLVSILPPSAEDPVGRTRLAFMDYASLSRFDFTLDERAMFIRASLTEWMQLGLCVAGEMGVVPQEGLAP